MDSLCGDIGVCMCCICTFICMCVYMFVCMYVCMHACMDLLCAILGIFMIAG